LNDGENNSASASTRSPATDNLATESQCSVNQDDSNNLLNEHVVDGGVAHPFATDDGNQGFHSNGDDGFNQLEYNVSLPAASPQISMHMADIVENRDGDEVMIQEDDFVNWDGSMVPTPESPQESNQWCVESNTSVPCPPTTSPHIVATPVKANNGHARHPGPARQAVFAAARQFLIRYILQNSD
jgi:hypothetical protein